MIKKTSTLYDLEDKNRLATIEKSTGDVSPNCPECGKQMKKRTAKKASTPETAGPFWGCSEYPECKQTVRIVSYKAPSEPSKKLCLQCGRPMQVRHGKSGPFLACSGFPGCKRTMPVESLEPKPEKCPECEEILTSRVGKFGPFTGCSGFPRCKYIKKSSKKRRQVGDCPKCEGTLYELMGKNGYFVGCSNFPDCKHKRSIAG